MSKFNILVSGAGSGLGHAVHTVLGGVALTRGVDPTGDAFRSAPPFDAIVHCAFNSAKSVSSSSAYTYLYDNLLLTERLLDIPHRKFIYVSSVDIYPDRSEPYREDDDFDVGSPQSLYAATKLASDCMVRERSRNYLILRPTSLLGPRMRPSTIVRVLTEANPAVFLHPSSRFNFVMNEDITSFIRMSIEQNISGIFNIASTGSVALETILDQLKLSVRTGEHRYCAKNADNGLIASRMPQFASSSSRTLNRFIETLGPRFVGGDRRLAAA